MCCAERDGDISNLFDHPVPLFDDEPDAEDLSKESDPPLSFVKVHLQVYGDVASLDFQKLAFLVQSLYEKRAECFVKPPQIFPLYEAEWSSYLENLQKLVRGGELWCLGSSAVLLCDSQCVGGPEQALDWMTETFSVVFELGLLERRVSANFEEALISRQNSVVYLDVSHDTEPVGRLVFELYDELLPLACQNFRQLCSGECGVSLTNTVLWYTGSPVHRIVRGGWLQAGDIVDGCGSHGESVYRFPFPDECFAVPHDRRGRLSLVQDERNHNHSQFMVAFQPMTYMQCFSCAFGQLIMGSSVLDYLEDVETNNERPKKTVAFFNSGVLYQPAPRGLLQPVAASSEDGTSLLALSPPPESNQESDETLPEDPASAAQVDAPTLSSETADLKESMTG